MRPFSKKRGFLQPLFPCPASEVRRGIKAYQCSYRTETVVAVDNRARHTRLKHINVRIELKQTLRCYRLDSHKGLKHINVRIELKPFFSTSDHKAPRAIS